MTATITETSSSTKRKTARKSAKKTKKKATKRAKTYSEDELNSIVEEAKEKARIDAEKKAQREALKMAERRKLEASFLEPNDINEDDEDYIFDATEETLNGVGLFGDDPIPSDQEQEFANAFDIFEFCQSKFMKNGTRVLYQIKRDGDFVAEIKKPYSLSQLQRDYGGGYYTVIARNAGTKEYLKQHTFSVADLPQRLETEKEVVPQAPPSPQLDPTKLIMMMNQSFKEMLDAARQERLREDKDEKRGEREYNSTLMTLMQSQSENQMKMFMEMQKNSQEMMKTIDENNRRSLEKMDDKFSKMIEKMTEGMNKKDELGLKDILELQRDAEDNGWSKFQLLTEMVESMAESRKENDSSDSGMMGKLINGVLPILSGASRQQQLMLQQAAARQGLNRAVRKPGMPPAPNQAPPQQRPNPSPQNERRAAPRNEGQIVTGLPTIADMDDEEAFVEEPEAFHKEVEAKEVESNKETANGEIEALFNGANEIQQAIAAVCVPIIASHVTDEEVGPINAAEECLQATTKGGLTPGRVIEEFSIDFLHQIAAAFGLGEDKKPWLERFYAHIEDIARVDAEGDDQPSLG